MLTDSLIHLTESLPITLDPAVAYDSSSESVIQNIYETLVTYEGSQVREVAPLLADAWSVSSDNRQFVFRLHPAVQFHNGQPLNAQAVIYSLRRAIRMNQGPAWILAQCLTEDGLQVVDDLMIEMTLTRAFPGFLYCLAHPVASVVEPTAVELHGGVVPGQENSWMAKHAIGTGPFSLGEQESSERLTLYRHDQYWRKPARLASVHIYQVSQESERISRLYQGEVDLADISSAEAWRMMGRSGIAVARGQGLDRELIGFNCRRAPFNDVRVRQAIAYAIDYDQLLALEPGYPLVRTIGPIPGQIEGHSADLFCYPHDLSKARALLQEAGYAEGFSTILGYNKGFAWRERIADRVAQSLSTLSIKVQMEALTWDDFLDRLKHGTLPMFAWNWVPDYPDPDCYVYPLYHSQSSENPASYSNPVMDSLIEAARIENDTAARACLCRDIQCLAIQDTPYLFMVQGTDLYAYRDHINGFVYHPLIQTGNPIYYYPLGKRR
jgi:peptide/nickel transport system substrate-binding protein